MTDFAATLRKMLDGAQAALTDGDAADSERLAKAISALVKAERDVAEFLNQEHTAALNDDEDACRAELLRRLALFDRAEKAGAPDDVLARIAATGASG